MTLKLTRSLWLWAGVLAFALLLIMPFTGWTRVVVALMVAIGVALAWRRTGRLFAHRGRRLLLGGEASLPPAAWRQPVILVCGDGLGGLFGAVTAGQLAVRSTAQGCYVRVPAVDQLCTVATGILALRPDWGGQLSVMFIANPGEHSDGQKLAGRVRTFCSQLALVRKRGIALPLVLVSYLQAAKSEGVWFSWEGARPGPVVRDAGACCSLADWQRQAPDSATGASRLCRSLQIDSAAAWLKQSVLAHFASRDLGPPLACVITQVPVLPGTALGNLWQQWLDKKTGLTDAGQSVVGADAALPFADSLLDLLSVEPRRSPVLRAGITALWLFVVAAVVAMVSSAWENKLLLRQVSDDLRRYHATAPAGPADQGQSALREDAVAVLREDAMRLDAYYRHGEPAALGLGLYRGEILRLPLLAIIARHRLPAPTQVATPAPGNTSTPVRLDSLSLFGTASAELKPGSTKVLIGALVNIKVQPDWLIVIAGHTDATGNPEQNLQLSRMRAAAVRDWMQRMGDIPDSCFAVQGFGASQPLASNDSETGRAANRRVDIRLVPEAGACTLPATTPG